MPVESNIGIWWDDGTTLVALTHPTSENSSRQAGFIDSNLNHVNEWPDVAAKFGRTARDEYFSLPRGRVVIHCRSGQGVIYHGSATSKERLKAIAEEFKLNDWKAVPDLHYESGLALDDLFDD